jgi:chemotaxis protein MotB
MSRRKKQASHENHERWLVSYADFITLLFAFFVVMFASSQGDKGKAAQISESVKAALENGQFSAVANLLFGGAKVDKGMGNAQMKGPGGGEKSEKDSEGGWQDSQLTELLPTLEFLTRELQDEIKAGNMQVSMEPRGLVVSFRQAAFFPSGEDVIEPGTFDTIEKVAMTIQRLTNPVRMEGHTDSVPIHNSRFRSNWELSAARSIAMLNLFVNRFQIPRERLSIAAYADNAPVATNETDEGRALNRRVDIILLSQLGVKAEPHPLPLPATAKSE